MADEVTLDFIAKQIERVLDEQAAMRNEQAAMREAIEHAIDEQSAMLTELRRMAENQMMTARSIQGLRDNLELMIRTEISGLFAHLESRLEQRIDAAIAKVP